MYRKRPATENENQSSLKKPKIALYLEDNTPVRTIEVTHFADHVTSEYLCGFFEHATGPVSDVSIVAKLENNHEIRVAYVTFVIPEDAASLICDPNLQSNPFTIKQAENAHQPKIDPNVLHFEDLNDDCLWHITSFLDLIDIANFGQASIRLQSFAHQIYQRHSKFSFNCDDAHRGINHANIRTILQEMGSFMRTIEWHGLSLDHMKYLSKFCENVDELTLLYPKRTLHSPEIKHFKKLFRQLTKLTICGASFFDTTLKMITASSKLKSLELIDCSNDCGKFLSTWKRSGLTALKVSNCRSINCGPVFEFERKHRLAQLSCDTTCSYKECLALPADCLSTFTEIELDFSTYNRDFLKDLNFEGLTQLTSLTMTYKNSDSAYCGNDLLLAVSEVRTLKSLTIESIRVDATTIQCLGPLTNLREVELKRVVNTVGQEMYAAIPVHLPKLTKLSINTKSSEPDLDYNSFLQLMLSLVDLKFFWHSSLTICKLVRYVLAIERGDLPRKRHQITITISEQMHSTLKALPTNTVSNVERSITFVVK